MIAIFNQVVLSCSMNAIVLNNVSVYTTSYEIADLLSEEGILIARNIVDFLNNSYSKTVVIQVHSWQDTEEAYHIIKNLRYNGETEIETRNGIFIANIAEQEEIITDVSELEQEQEIEPDPKCEELDEYLQYLSEEDEAIWMREYEKVSSNDEISRDESYLYLDLCDLIGEEFIQ